MDSCFYVSYKSYNNNSALTHLDDIYTLQNPENNFTTSAQHYIIPIAIILIFDDTINTFPKGKGLYL